MAARKKSVSEAITASMSEKDALEIGGECKACGKCCMYGSGFVLESEIPRIANFLKIPTEKFREDFLDELEIFHTYLFKIRSLKKKGANYGPCMFLENGKCRIHKVKPLHCGVCNCARGDDLHVWFMVNYLLKKDDPESVRQYASYVRTGGRLIPGAELKELFPDAGKLKAMLNYDIIR